MVPILSAEMRIPGYLSKNGVVGKGAARASASLYRKCDFAGSSL
jgi:hypothetical protein